MELNLAIRHVIQSMHGINERTVKSALRGLEIIEKASRIHKAALDAGWSIDDDEWWWRQMRAGDKHFDESHFGFTTRDDVEDEAQNCVFVRCPTYALAYDRGEIIPYKQRSRAFNKIEI